MTVVTQLRLVAAGDVTVQELTTATSTDQPPVNCIIRTDDETERFFTYATRIDEGQGEDRHGVLIYRETVPVEVFDNQTEF
jgi:hypothetical protein